MLQVAEHVDALEREGRLLADAAERAGLDASVPSCPDWDVRALLRHIRGVHRWAASYVRDGRQEPSTDEEDRAFFAAPGDDELLPSFRAGHRELVSALRRGDRRLSCWTFLPAPFPIAFWARRQAHKTAVHGADAELATGSDPAAVPAAFAADGIDELLRGFLARPTGWLTSDPPTSLALRAADTGQCWRIWIGPDRRETSSGGDADCVVRASAAQLYWLVWNRLQPEAVAVSGERSVLRLWRERATVHWG